MSEELDQAVEPSPGPGLLRDHDFVSVLVGQGISAMGSAVTMVAMPLLVLLATGSGLLMGLVGILETAPDLLFGLPAGAYADRWDRRRVMIVADCGRALLTALIPLAVIVGLPAVPVIFLVVGPINVLRVLFSAAQNASVPALAGRDRLNTASGYFEAVWGLGYVLGPALAGVLIALVGPGLTIALDAASFAFSAGSVVLVRRSLVPPPSEEPRRNVLRDMREGVGYVWGHRTLRMTIAYYAVVSLVMAPFVPAFTYFIVRDRGMGASGLGLMVSIFSIGMVVGAIGATRLKGLRLGLRMLTATLIVGAGLTLGRLTPSAAALGALGLAVGAAWTVVEVSYVTLRLSASPEALLGRVSTVANTATMTVTPIGMLAGGLLIDRIGGGATLAAMGLAAVAIALASCTVGSIRTARVDEARAERVAPAAAATSASVSAAAAASALRTNYLEAD
jgi:MFS family permease